MADGMHAGQYQRAGHISGDTGAFSECEVIHR